MTDGATIDAALIERSREGDTDAFRQLFGRKHRRVYLIAYQILGDTGRAEDVAQEVFLRLWHHCASYNEAFSLDSWLARIATNRAIDHWRARRADSSRLVWSDAAGAAGEPALADGELCGRSQSPGPEEVASWRQLQEVWDELASLLPPQQRAAFVLREIEELDTAEVAEALGCSASTVRSHVAEARATLRVGLKERYPELVRARSG